MNTGKWVTFAASFITGVVLCVYLSLPMALLLALPVGAFYGYLGAWYDRG